MKKSILAMMALSACILTTSAVYAEEAEEQDVIQIEAEGNVVEVVNSTSEAVKEAVLSVETEEKEETTEETSEETETAEITCLVLTEEDGDVHTFKNVEVADWSDAVLYNEYEILYIKYNDPAGKEQEVAEDVEENVFEEALTMYTTARVNVREEAGTDAKALRTAEICEEWEVVGVVPGWFHVKNEKEEGYIHHFYMTEDKAEAEKILEEKKAAEAAALAAQQAAAQQAAAQQQAAQQEQKPQAPYEVGRVAYDDCDGSGHGYYEITYSDGSVVIQEY